MSIDTLDHPTTGADHIVFNNRYVPRKDYAVLLKESAKYGFALLNNFLHSHSTIPRKSVLSLSKALLGERTRWVQCYGIARVAEFRKCLRDFDGGGKVNTRS